MSPRRTKWEFLRRRTIWILIVLLVPPFIIFFSGAGQAPRSGGAVGKIFGAPVPREAFEQRQAWVSLKLSNAIQGISRELLDQLVQQQVWQDLLFLAEAKRQRLRVSDRELAAAIERISAFQQDGLPAGQAGRFRADYYRAYLRSQGMSPQLFEGLLRNDLLIERLISSVNESVSLSVEELKAAFHEAHDQLRASLLFFDPASSAKEAAAALTEEDLRASYDTHQEELRIPEQISLEYAGASRDEMMARLEPSEEELTAFYEARQDEFTTEDGTVKPLDEVRERVRERVMDVKARRALTALAIDLDEDVTAKRPFEEIVKTRALNLQSAGPLPADTQSSPEGPEPDVLKAAAALKEQEMSDVVETEQGVYLARLTKRTPSRIPPLEEVRDAIRERLITERARAAAKQAAEALRATLEERRKAGMRFEEALLAAGTHPDVKPVLFTRADPIDPMGSVPEVNRAAFDTPLEGLTEVLETPVGFVIVRPEALLPADEAAFTELAEGLRKDAFAKKQGARFEQWVKDLQERAKVEKFLTEGDGQP